MSDLDVALEELERLMPKGMIDKKLIIITFESGFELGLSLDKRRCHETWCQGWVVSDVWELIRSGRSAYLEKAVEDFSKMWRNPPKWLEGRAKRHDLPPWHPMAGGDDE